MYDSIQYPTYHWNGITVDYWRSLLKDASICNTRIMSIIEAVYEAPDQRVCASQLALYFGYSGHSPLNAIVGGFGHSIYNRLESENPGYFKRSGFLAFDPYWWNIVFDGAKQKSSSRFDWIMKENMALALDEIRHEQALRVSDVNRQPTEGPDIQIPIYAYEETIITKARVGQGIFRKKLLEKYAGRCVIYGLSHEDLLIASHIKPWAVSNSEEKGHPSNGLLLCTAHDALFDKGLLSFDENGRMLVCSALSAQDRKLLGVSGTTYIHISPAMAPFMSYHRLQVFQP